LSGLTLLALARRPSLLERVCRQQLELTPVIQEVTRFEPSTSTTVRFVAEDAVIAGQLVKTGDVVIVSIASANRDPAFNVNPDRFDPLRSERRCLEFGTGAHACPANRLAPLMAEVLVDHVLSTGVDVPSLADIVTYAPSAHVRIPRFGGGGPRSSF